MHNEYYIEGPVYGAEIVATLASAGPMNITGVALLDRNPITGFDAPIGDDERRANRAMILKEALNVLPQHTVVPKLQHGGEVKYVQYHNKSLEDLKCDALVTDQYNLALTVSFADCPPVVLMDPEFPVLGIIHGGWKPIAAGIIERTVDTMVRYGAKASRLQVLIGPGIRRCCYEVGPDVAKVVDGIDHVGHVHIDLSDIIYARLVARGVDRDAIDQEQDCTKCKVDPISNKPVYFSYRREKKLPANGGMCVAILR